jgi:hypothetical protein
MGVTVNIWLKCCISGSHSSDYIGYSLLGCDIMYCDLNSLTTQRYIMLKNTSCKKPVCRALSDFFLSPADVGTTSL